MFFFSILVLSHKIIIESGSFKIYFLVYITNFNLFKPNYILMSNNFNDLANIKGFGKDVNDYLNHYVTVADAKSAAIIASNFILAGVVIDLDISKHDNCLIKLFLVIASLCIIISIIISFISIYPRLPYDKMKGLIFWESIRNYKNIQEYLSDYQNLTGEQKELLYAKQNYYISSVLQIKNKNIRLSIFLLIISVIALGISILIIKSF